MSGEGHIFWIAIALSVLCVAALSFFLFGKELAGGGRARKRIQNIDTRAKRSGGAAWTAFGGAEQSARDRLKMLADEQKRKNSKAQTLRMKMEQAGMSGTPPARFLMGFHVAALVVGAVVFFFSGQGLVAAGAASVVAFLLPKMWLSRMIDQRVNKFLDIFPNAIDILVRGVKSGLPVGESMKVAANELPDPVGEEFARVIASTNMGVSLEEALNQMSDRLQSPDVNFFRTVLIIQKQTGGNLAEALSNLSGILRDRRKMKLKIRALSAEARMSAIIIGALPFIVGMLVYFMKPDYIMVLFTHETGRMLLAGAAVWMVAGVLIMRRMIRFKI